MIIKGNIITFPRSSRITNQNFDMTYQPYLSILLIIFKICYYLFLTKLTKRVFLVCISCLLALINSSLMKCLIWNVLMKLVIWVAELNVWSTHVQPNIASFAAGSAFFSLAFLIDVSNWLQSITSKISMYFLLDGSVNCTPLMWFHLSLCLFQFHCHYTCHLLLSKDWCLLFHNSIQLFTCNSTDITYGVSK